VYNNIGITLKNKNDIQGALKSFEKAVEVDSHYILGYTNKA
jgi:lipoprotein NlpI